MNEKWGVGKVLLVLFTTILSIFLVINNQLTNALLLMIMLILTENKVELHISVKKEEIEDDNK